MKELNLSIVEFVTFDYRKCTKMYKGVPYDYRIPIIYITRVDHDGKTSKEYIKKVEIRGGKMYYE